MNEILSIALFLLGFILILKGGDLMVEASVRLADATKIPSMVIGATIVSVATTLPEATVSFLASMSQQEELALNIAIGSIICNFALVLGITFLMLPSKIDSKALFKRSVFFALVLIVLVVFAFDLEITLFEGIILLIIFVLFLCFNLYLSKTENYSKVETSNVVQPQLYMVIIQFVLSTIAIGYGASVLVNNVKNISTIFGISEQIIGLSLISIGTNIPEIVTTIASVKQSSPEIGVGNIFGASLINATLLIGGSTLLASDHQITIQKYILVFCLPILFITLIALTLPIFKRGKSTRKQGVLLLTLYALYSILMAIIL